VEVAAALLKSLDREYRILIEEPAAQRSILRRFEEQSSWARGKQVHIEESVPRIEGTTEGLDERGFLQVRTAQGLQRVLSGTVRAQ
jgi:BirA family biotin operon repressor/biotin-[acetyl-CoA-carboxylase] ligase